MISAPGTPTTIGQGELRDKEDSQRSLSSGPTPLGRVPSYTVWRHRFVNDAGYAYVSGDEVLSEAGSVRTKPLGSGQQPQMVCYGARAAVCSGVGRQQQGLVRKGRVSLVTLP